MERGVRVHTWCPGLQAAFLWNGKKKPLSKTLSHPLPAAKGVFFKGWLSGLTWTCFRVWHHCFKRFALGKTAFITNFKKIQNWQPVGSFPTRMWICTPTCSGHRHNWAGKRARRNCARPRHKSSILTRSAAKWEGTTSFLILSPLLKSSRGLEGGSTGGGGGRQHH
jgi:hypothetical protein